MCHCFVVFLSVEVADMRNRCEPLDQKGTHFLVLFPFSSVSGISFSSKERERKGLKSPFCVCACGVLTRK